MGVYPSENFTDDEAAVLRPYFTNLDRPVFALVNLPEVVKGALFARYSRTHKSLRRLFLDEFVERPRPHRRPHRRRDRRAAAGGGAVRPRVPRIRRRLRRAARWRAPRVRAVVEPAHQDPRVGSPHGVPRAVDALHRVRQEARRPLPLLPRQRGARSTASSHGATSPTWTRCSTPTPRCCRRLIDWARERYPKDPADSDFVYKQTHQGEGVRRGPRHPPRGDAVERRHLRHRSGVTRRCCCACARTRCPRRGATRR